MATAAKWGSWWCNKNAIGYQYFGGPGAARRALLFVIPQERAKRASVGIWVAYRMAGAVSVEADPDTLAAYGRLLRDAYAHAFGGDYRVTRSNTVGAARGASGASVPG
jgi:hypothetical protein